METKDFEVNKEYNNLLKLMSTDVKGDYAKNIAIQNQIINLLKDIKKEGFENGFKYAMEYKLKDLN